MGGGINFEDGDGEDGDYGEDGGNFYIGEKWKVQPSSEVNPGELRSVSEHSLSAQCWISVLPPVRN